MCLTCFQALHLFGDKGCPNCGAIFDNGEYTLIEKIKQHLNLDKDGDYFLTKESYDEIFKE